VNTTDLRRWIALGLLVGAIACKSAPQTSPETSGTNNEPLLDREAEGSAAAGTPAPTAQPLAAPAPPPSSPPGTIAQSELFRFLDNSPGVFLSHVDAEARLVAGRFAGWRIRSFFPGDARFSSTPIKPGDVVLRVNGSTLERPDQLSALWKKLREATQLEVEVNRGGSVTVLLWPIVADQDKVTR
jgi:hypothetical protein